MKTRKPVLTISLLISNRPDTIPRCLDSLHLIMDKIPCELILIDTSKSEEIHNLLLTYTDKVYEFEWCKDFAKARNEGVRRAKGEWFLFLDDDEWFTDVDELVDFFKSGKYKKEECANFQIRNYLNTEYTEYTYSWGTRLFNLGNGAKFHGKVHEYIEPIYKEPVFLQSVADHSGYAFKTTEERTKHSERNIELLVDSIEKDPENLRWVSHLVQEYRAEEDWEPMVALCKKYIVKKMDLPNYMQRNHFCTIYGGLVEGLTNLKKDKNAIEVCKIGLEDERGTDLLKAFLHFYAALNYGEQEAWDKANEHIKKYFEIHELFEKHKEEMNTQLGALVVFRIFEKGYFDKASNLLLYTELKREGIDMPLVEDGEDVEVEMDGLSGHKFIKAMINLIASTEYKPAFQYFLDNISRSEILCEWACAEAQQWEEKDPQSFERIAYALSKAESDFWYICYCRVIEADIHENKTEVEKRIEELLKQLKVVFFLPDRVYEIIDKYDIKIALLWDKIAGEEWQIQTKDFVMECADIYIDKAYDYILDVYEENDWHAQSMVETLQEKMLLEQQREELLLLRGQIIEQVKGMYAIGNIQSASQFLTQLKVMFPEDEEVIELEKYLGI